MQRLSGIIIAISLLFSQLSLYSQQPENNKDTIIINSVIDANSPIISTLDSLVNIKFFKDTLFSTDSSVLNKYGFPSDSVPVYPDSVYKKRLEQLNKTTPIELTYNKTVKNFIHLYSIKKRDLTSRILGLGELYFPLFEEQLDKYNLPLELKYLAVVESALNPTAGSRRGAKGLWQFMYHTGKTYNLNVNSLIDERYDPLKSSIAACQHLKDLYDIYGNWSLAMAAYNSGAGNVNKAIRRAGNIASYWAVWPFLPRETRGYVPAFIAVLYVMNYAAEHNLYPKDPGILYKGIDTVIVSQPLSFDQISEMLKIKMKDLKFLNPQYKVEIIPAGEGKKFSLRLPVEFAGDFVSNENALYQYKSKKGIEREKLLAEIKKAQSRKVHIVRYGENLSLIAERYHCYVSQIKRWNNLRGNTIYPVQKLIIYSPFDDGYKAFYSETTDDKKFIYYTVKRGDTLWEIARQYDGVTVTEIKRLNNIRNSHRIRPGQRIKLTVSG